MLTLKHVTKRFRKTIAVNDLNIECKNQEFLVIFGPAGAGKSTTLRLIAGISPLTEGEISFNGQSLTDVPPEHRNMAMAFENYALYSHLSVFDNIAFPLRARNIDKNQINQQVGEMAELLQIAPLLDRKPGQMSGGQRQRVALGRALIRDADVYLLDEPISHLDAKLRHHMRGKLKAICAEWEATVVYVTHDYKEAMAFADRIAVLNKGKLVQLGTPHEVYHSPSNEFVAGFLGDPPMGILDAEIRQENGRSLIMVGDSVMEISQALVNLIDEQNQGSSSIRLGIRATDIQISPQRSSKYYMPAEVYVVETFGYRNIITCRLQDQHLIQSVSDPSLNFDIQDTAWLNISEDNIHIFSESGKSISHPKPQQMIQ